MIDGIPRPASDGTGGQGPVRQRYALIDLAAAPVLRPLIDRLVALGAAQCLFEGALPDAVRRVSPYIVAMARAPELSQRWRGEGTGQNWGVVMEADMTMHAARRHVRHFLQVKLPDGTGPVLCRLWDPRVLSLLLRHSDANWLHLFRRGGTIDWNLREE